jgi:hypothetical protein
MENYPEICIAIKKREDPFVRGQQTDDIILLKTFNTINRDYYKYYYYYSYAALRQWRAVHLRTFSPPGSTLR